MDDRRFDSLAKSLAAGASRRSVLKGLLGFGGAALTSTVLVGGDTDAARRSTPTPTSVKCPGRQTWNGSACVCPSGLVKCGPDCCHSTVPPTDPTYSICCDQACCPYPNDCVGEEMCCPRLPDVACLTPSGACCTTLCEETPGGAVCCPTSQFCAGGTTSDDLCCSGDTPIKCDCGTNANACIADTDAACCHDSDCDTPPPGSTACAIGTCRNHICQYTDCNTSTEVCCPDNTGKHACRVGDECCLSNQDCADTCEACVNFVCVDDPNTFPCGPTSDPDKYCCPETNYSLCCGATQYECCGLDSATGITRECDADGKCCESGTPYFCAGNSTCCSAECVVFGEAEYCCDPAAGRICPGAASFVCCPNGQECSDAGDCCPAGSVACGDECCPVDSVCCPVVGPVPTDGACCASIDQCNTAGECCPADTVACGADCCDSETEVCCADGQGGYSCEAGPYCGCDNDEQCANLTDPTACQVGWCDMGACKTKAASENTVCHAAGTSAICDPAVYCNGSDQSCPTPPLPPVGTSCGDCMECDGDGACVSTGTVCGEECCAAPSPYCCTDHCVAGDECCADGDCTGAPDLCHTAACTDGTCVYTDTCAGECCAGTGNCCLAGTHCGSNGDCVPDCIPTGNSCGSTDTCCDGGVCCNGTCATTYTYCGDVCYPGQLCCPEDAHCVYNADCCPDGDKSPCCRETGGVLTCKPGEGNCHCEVNSDCDVVKNKPNCVNGTCSS